MDKQVNNNVHFNNQMNLSESFTNEEITKLTHVFPELLNSSEDIISYSINNYPATTNLGEEDCSSNVIQIDENHSIISFRRDSSANLDIYLFQDDSLVKQFKTAATYFFSVIVTKDGWFIGTGGLDAPFINEKVEALAMEVVKSGKITEEYMQAILNLKLISGTGHCLIKAPNGNYGLITANKAVKDPMLEISKLNEGEYIVCPNSPIYYSKGDYLSKTSISDPVIASRYLAATDKYTLKQRHDILTYNFTKDGNGSHVDVYVANDDNHLVTNGSDLTYCDGIWILSKYEHISPADIPVIMNGLYVNTFYFNNNTNHTKIGTTISGSDLKISAYATKNLVITLKDVNGNVLAGKKVTINFNGKTYTRTTNSKGQAKLAIISKNVKTYKITIKFAGERNYLGSSKSLKVNIYSAYVTVRDIIKSAKILKSYSKKNKKLPSTIKVGAYKLTHGQLSYLMVATIKKLNAHKKVSTKIKVINVKVTTSNKKVSRKVYKFKYMKIVNTIYKKAVKGTLPKYVKYNTAKIRYNTYTYSLAKILAFYSNKNRLPHYCVFKRY